MAAAQSRRYTIYIDNTEAQSNLDRMQERARRLTDEINRIQAAGGNATRQMQALANTQQQIGALETSIRSGLTRSLRDLQNEVTRTQNLLNRATDPETIRQLNAQLTIAQRNLLEYRANVLGVESAQRQLTSANANFGQQLRSGVKDYLFGNLMARGIEMAITAIKDFVAESFNAAVQAEAVTNKFKALNDPLLLRNMRAAVKGTVSDLELMKAAVKAENFKIPLESLGTLLAFAKKQAGEMGESVDYMTNSIVTGLARKSLPILDNLGLSSARINEEMQRTGDFAKAVSNIIEEEMAKAGEAINTAADKVGRWRAAWENAKLWAGNAMLSLGEDFSYLSTKMFGDDDQMIAAEKRRFDYLLQQHTYTKKFYEDELDALEYWKRQYESKEGEAQKKLLQITKEGIAGTEKLQQEAYQKGNTVLALRLQERVNIWTKYFKSIEVTAPQNVNTLEALKSESDTLSRQLETLEIGSDKYKATLANLKRVQKEIEDANGSAAERAAEKAKQLAEKDQRQKEQLIKQLEEFTQKYNARQLSGYEREIYESESRYNKLRAQLIKYGIDTKELDENRMKERFQIYQKYSGAEYGKTHDLVAETPQARIKKGQANTTSRLMDDIDQFTKDQSKKNKNNVDAAELAVMMSRGAKQLEAQKALLAAQRKQELDNTDLTATERAKIEEEYRQKEWEAETNYYKNKVDQFSSYLGGMLSLYESWSSIQKQKEDNELAKDKAINDRKKEQYKKQLDSKLISQAEYDRKVGALDAQLQAKEAALKKKQFEREKVANITKAVMGTAQAVVQALTAGPFLGPILAAATAALGAVQIGIIAAQKAPEYGKGGKLKGPKHDSPSNGLPVVNPEDGAIQAYLEGDEGILRRAAMYDTRQYTATGTISQIASMFNSMHGGTGWEQGARVRPFWMSFTPNPVNFSGVNTTMSNIRAFATGGRYTVDSTPTPQADSPVTDPQLLQMILQNSQVLSQLSEQLSGGIQAFVELKQLQTQQDRLNAVREAATFKA